MNFRKLLLVCFFSAGALAYSSPEKTIICIEGCMGAGKSTLMKLLSEKFDWAHPVHEPVEKWRNVGDGKDNLLDIFFQDQWRWTFTLGMYVVLTRISDLEAREALKKGEVYITDSSIYTDRYCYAKASYKLGYTKPFEWTIYKEWLSWVMRTCSVKPKGFVYLKSDTNTSITRIMRRARSEEAGFPIKKIQALHECYDDFLFHRTAGRELSDVPVLILDGTRDFEHNLDTQNLYLKQIEEFIKSI